jgi:eukaryotic-like serine/threonine-protein kinase
VDVYVGSLDNMPARRVFKAGSDVSYAAPGYLLFVRQQTLVAQRFDPVQLTITGDPIPIAQDVARSFSTGMFSVSDTGTLVYRSLTEIRLTTVDRAGRGLGAAAPPGEYRDIALSPDGRRVAFDRPSSSGIDVWVRDLDRGTTSRLTSQPQLNDGPVWSPNGETIAFATGRNGALDFFQRPSNGTGSDALLLTLHAIPILFASDWSSDGRFLAYYRTGPKGNYDLWVVALEGARTPTLFLGTEFNESQGQFSPDGRWMAYVSDESGGPQVYVQSFPTPTERVAISTSGGSQPRWRRDGKELFYLAADRKLMATTIVPGTKFMWEAPRALFETGLSFTALRQDYGVSPDGQRFVLRLPGADKLQPMIAVLNWPALLSR